MWPTFRYNVKLKILPLLLERLGGSRLGMMVLSHGGGIVRGPLVAFSQF